MIKKLPIIVVLLTIHFSSTLGQTDKSEDRISGIFMGMTFERFAQIIQERSEYQFYFRAQDMEGFEINISAQNNTLTDILKGIFSDTAFNFGIDPSKRVFISKGEPLDVVFPKSFFTARQADTSTSGEGTSSYEEDRALAKNKLWEIGTPQKSLSANESVLRGRVLSYESRIPIVEATVFAAGHSTRVMTDAKGNYEIVLPKGRHTLIFQSFGAYQEQRQINLVGDGVLDVLMEDNVIALAEVTINMRRSSNLERPEMGLENMTIQSMKKIPAVLGEVDVLRAVLTLPGVKTVGEASVGFNVRGGAADQNLIFFNQATIYNPSHLFGLFSAFNPDMVESVDLYKAGIPIQYGGRLSSVLDVKGKFGNKEKFSGGGGIGLLTSRLYLEGPLGKKTTFAVGGRTTYSNWLFGLLDEESEFRDSRASFYDLNLNISHEIDENNEIRLSTYGSSDGFRFDRDTTFQYQNRNVNLSWIRYFNDRLEANFTLGHDYYDFNIDGDLDPFNAFDFGFSMNQSHWRNHFKYELDEKHTLSFGMNHVLYRLSAGNLTPKGEESLVIPDRVQSEKALETAFYIGDEYEIDEKWLLNYGFRYAIYNYLGPQDVNRYPEGMIKSESTVSGISSFDPGKIINTYHGPEFRVSARYAIDDETSVKAGFNTGRQHIHMLTNTSAIAPTDTWKLSDPNIAPQLGEQLSAGYFRNFKENTIETSVEVYYRRLRNLVDFGSGATLILNDAIEQDILNTVGRAYGIELMAKKTTGKLNGWVSYTYSRSLLRTSDREPRTKINGGRLYPSNFDQPHDVMIVANYEFTKRVNTSLNANYSTGRPITLPIAKFNYGGAERVFYSDRNEYRIPDYFRMDFSVNIEGNHKIRKLAHASWSAGIYNVLGRSNPYSVYFAPVNGLIQGYKLSIFARPIPFITYNFRF